MNPRRIMGIATLAGLLLGAGTGCRCGSEAGTAARGAPACAWQDDATLVWSAGEWTLRIVFTDKGTRSEGQDGVLLRNGKAVPPAAAGDTLETALGTMKYYGSERVRAWDVTGWHFADRRQIKPSAFIGTEGQP